MLPDSSAWLQYPIVAVIVLAAAVIAYGLYKLFRDLLTFIKDQDVARVTWIENQNAAREQEREKQRTWQAEQDRVRDARWQEFLKAMQNEWIAQDGRNNEALRDMIKKLDGLINAVGEHYKFTREAIAAMRERTSK